MEILKSLGFRAGKSVMQIKGCQHCKEILSWSLSW